MAFAAALPTVRARPAAAASVTKRPRVAEYDFSFGFLNAEFSDCSLVLTNLLFPDQKQELAVLPVCSLVLASKSDYFKRLFGGGFKESLEKRRVEIGINPTDVRAFKQLLHFIYTNCLEKSFQGTVLSYHQVAFLADRFHVRECVVFCAECLEPLIKQADHTVALEFLALQHEHIPELNRVAKASEALFVSKSMLLLQAPKQPAMIALPQWALLILARSPQLNVDSEDVLAARIMEWIEVNAPGQKALVVYVQVLWKHVRICQLSPAFMMTVVCNTLKAMDSSGLKRMPKVVGDSMGQALELHDGGRDHALQLATLCVTMLAEAGLMSPAESVSFTTIKRNDCRQRFFGWCTSRFGT